MASGEISTGWSITNVGWISVASTTSSKSSFSTCPTVGASLTFRCTPRGSSTRSPAASTAASAAALASARSPPTNRVISNPSASSTNAAILARRNPCPKSSSVPWYVTLSPPATRSLAFLTNRSVRSIISL